MKKSYYVRIYIFHKNSHTPTRKYFVCPETTDIVEKYFVGPETIDSSYINLINSKIV